jgi:PAS domain S-box-containing protein
MPWRDPIPAGSRPDERRPGLLGLSHRVTMAVSLGLVLAGVVASIVSWRQAVDSEHRSESQQLEAAAVGVAARLEAAVSTQRQLINDISGLFSASGLVSREEFAVFADNARRSTPAQSLGMGFIQRVAAGDLAAFTAAARNDGAPEFTPHPAGNRAEWAVLLYNEPASLLASSWGLDVSTLEATRVALNQARDTGRPVLSDRLVLAIDRDLPPAERPAGFVLYSPVYAGGRDPGTVEGRRAALIGWANMPMRAHELLSVAADEAPEPVAVRMSDTRSRPTVIATSGTPISRATHVVTADVHGSQWSLAVSPGTGWPGSHGSAALILVGGLLASGVLGLLLLSLSGAKRRAQTHADAATRRLAASEARLRATIAGAPDLILVVAGDGTILSASDQAMPLLGYRPEDLEGQPVEVLLPPSARKVHVHHRGAFLAGPRTRTMGEGVELAACRADGSEVPVEIGLSPLVADDGTVQVIAVVRDVTARRRAEADQRLLASFVASTREAVLTTDLDGRVTSWNSGAERLFGWSAAEALGRHVTFIVPEQDRAEALHRLTAIAGGAPFEPFQRPALRRDGTVVQTTVTLAPLRDHSGRVIGSSCLARDMTAELAARQALESYAADLERSNRDLEEFAYIVSHDLSEPLRVVGGYADLIAARYGEGQSLDEAAVRYIGTMTAGVERMRQLIEGVLALSRLRTASLQLGPVSLDAVMTDVRANLETQLSEAGAELVVESLPAVWGDAAQIIQLLQNLVSNAVKFRRKDEPPRVVVSAHREGERWAIAVSDNGIGIEPEFHDRVFAMFRRLHGRDEYAGTGIGLALCRRVVDLHGGELRVESAPGQGSTFTFTLAPAHAEPALAGSVRSHA